MTTCADLADYDWLTGSDAGALLEELAGDGRPLHTIVHRLRSRVTPKRAQLLLLQLHLRARAAGKFSHPARMFFTDLALKQATDEWVARYKAIRFFEFVKKSNALVADFCCGIGGDLMGLAEVVHAVGIDRDPVSTCFAAANTRASTRTMDVNDFPMDSVAAWNIDPDRRPKSRRTTSLDWSEPNRETIERLLNQVPHAAVKLAPAYDVPAEWLERCELEWISRDRECRQLVAWHGALAHAPGRRRATVLSRSGKVLRTIVGEPDRPIELVEKPERYVFDIDSAVLAARLKGALAADHGLFAFANGPTYLTGSRPIEDAALSCFEVDQVAPFRVEKLRQQLRERSIGQLEIKTRGVDVDVETLRRGLKLRGEKAVTMLITRVAGRATAILACRQS
jgi:hypothetical protein